LKAKYIYNLTSTKPSDTIGSLAFILFDQYK